jgi:diguanylate cyclase (GGDEF)-like protein/PAS domain S-box-containing protein
MTDSSQSKDCEQTFFRGARVPMLLINPKDGSIEEANSAACAFYGHDPAEMKAMRISDINTAPAEETAAILSRVQSGQLNHLYAQHRLASGELREVEVHSGPVELGGKELLYSIVHDITERRKAEKLLRMTSSVFEESREGIIITDPDVNIIKVNRAFCALTGYDTDEVMGKNPRILQSGHQGRDFYQGMWNSLREAGFWHGEIWNRRKSGEVYAEDLSIISIHDEQGNILHYVGMFSDITEKKRQHERIEHLAYHDALTRLPNRTLLSDRMKQALARAARNDTRVAVCYLDLDGFKIVNDMHGHRAGDKLLSQVARRLEASVRAEDTVARLGGDEFVVLLTDLTTAMEEGAILPRILERLSEPCTLDEGKSASVSASIGVAVYPGDGNDPDSLIRQADQAMYEAKQSGRNRIHLFDSQRNSEARTHREIITQVRTALGRQEFLLHFQPRVNLRKGTIVGAEALLRWRQGADLISPGMFLAAVENEGVIIDIGDWVLEESLSALERWQEAGLSIDVSVNIAARQLLASDFAEHVEAVLARHKAVSPSHLELEILEATALKDLHAVTRAMEECRKLGVQFSLDDFGTGFASLTYFRKLPASVIKIDQSFVRDMLRDPADMSIIKGILGMTAAFSRTAVAEGVEDAAHAPALLALGLDVAQGYAIARPMAEDDFVQWAHNFKPDPVWTQV